MISRATLEEAKALIIDCAEFSYAEIPHYYALTLGVTGTLESLSESEINIIQNVFRIKNFSFAPSVYGES